MIQRQFDLLVFDWEGTLASSWISNSLFPGVYEMLKELHEVGYLLGVATGKSRYGLNRDMQAMGVQGFFDDTCTADESRAKPDPAMLRKLGESLGIEPSRMLMIGDTTYDLEMAAQFGAFAIAVTYGLHAVSTLKLYKPLYCASDVAQLHKWLLLYG